MGAPNFGRVNASKLYAVLFPYEEVVLNEDGEETEEVNYVHPERYEIEEEVNYYREMLEALPYSTYGKDRKNSKETFITSLSKSKNYGDIEVNVEVYCHLQHGYHEGAVLDWYVNLYVNNSDWEDKLDLGDVIDEFRYSSELPVGMQKILAPKALKWLETTKKEMIEKVEDIYDEVCGFKLKVDGVFSNGEAVYSKID